MKASLINIILILSLPIFILNYSIPCQSYDIQKNLEALPCAMQDSTNGPKILLNQFTQQANTFRNLSFSGWWSFRIPALPSDEQHEIFSIGDPTEYYQYYKRVGRVQISTVGNNIYIHYQQGLGSVNYFEANQSFPQTMHEAWFFLMGSINLDTGSHFLYLTSEQNSVQISLSLTSTIYTNFQSDLQIAYGAFPLQGKNVMQWGGCGYNKYTKIHPNFAFSQINQIDPLQWMKGATNILVIYSMNSPAAQNVLLYDESGNHNHALKTNTLTDPQWISQNQGLLFPQNSFLELPTINFQTIGDILISFWFSPLSFSQYSIIRLEGFFDKSPQINIICYNTTNEQKLKFNFLNYYNQQVSNPSNFTLNNWYYINLACYNIEGKIVYKCDYLINHRSSSTPILSNFEFTSFKLNITQLSVILGDNNSSASQFIMKELILTNGYMTNTKNSTGNCIENCEIYIQATKCLLCSQDYYLNPITGVCEYTSSPLCTIKDPDIRKCRNYQTFCYSGLPTPSSNCTFCPQGFFFKDQGCLRCTNPNCNQCNTEGLCNNCYNGRMATQNCKSCDPYYYDEIVNPVCKPISNFDQDYLPGKILFFAITQQEMTSTNCQYNANPTDNTFNYNEMKINEIQDNQFSFSFWFMFYNISQGINLFHLDPSTMLMNAYMNQGILQMRTLLQAGQSMNMQLVKVKTNQWYWGLFSLDINSKSNFGTIYLSNEQVFFSQNYMYINDNGIVNSQVKLFLGTKTSGDSADCNFQGKYMGPLFVYHSLNTNQILVYGKNFYLYQLMKHQSQPIQDYMSMITAVPLQTLIDYSGQNSGTAFLGTTSAMEPDYDPTYNWYFGFVFTKSNIITIPNVNQNQFMIRYYVTKSVADQNFYTYQRKSSIKNVMSIQHLAKVYLQTYQLQVCLLKSCFIPNHSLTLNFFHSIAVSLLNLTQYSTLIDIVIDTNKFSYIYQDVQTISYTDITDQTTIGSTLNNISDKFFIKNFKIYSGGAFLSLDQGAYNNLAESNCQLFLFKANQSKSLQCIDCRYGYVFNPTIEQCEIEDPEAGKIYQYCDLQAQSCTPYCTGNLYYDPITMMCSSVCSNGQHYNQDYKKCVAICDYGVYRTKQENYTYYYYNNTGVNTTATSTSTATPLYPNGTIIYYLVIQQIQIPEYYLNTMNNKCVQQCPVGYFGNPNTTTCTQKCPELLFGNKNTRLCSQFCQDSFADPLTKECECECSDGYFANPYQQTCDKQCPMGLYANQPTKKCEEICSFGLFADNMTNYCVTTCPNYFYADPELGRCEYQCSSGYYKESYSHKCYKICPDGFYADNQTNTCAQNCTGLFLRDNITHTCSLNCSNQQLADINNNLCTYHCISGLFANYINLTCDSSCLSPFYADSTTNNCVLFCPDPLLADPQNRQCSSNCSGSTFYMDFQQKICTLNCLKGFFADNNTKTCERNCTYGFAYQLTNQCLAQCPTGYIASPSLMKCVSSCSGNQYYNPLTNTCGSICPANYSADLITQSCLPYDSECQNQFCINPNSHRCQEMTADTYQARLNETHFCSNLNQQINVDQCLQGSYCIDNSTFPNTSCIQLINRIENTNNNYCSCLQNQCRKHINNIQITNISGGIYKCVDMTNDLQESSQRIGREILTQLCLGEGTKGTNGAERCAKNYCIDQAQMACVFMNQSNSSLIARAASNHSCQTANVAIGVDNCAEENYCIDSSQGNLSQCIFLNGRVQNLENVCRCSLDSCILFDQANHQYSCVYLNDSEPNRIGKQKGTQFCLQQNNAGLENKGAERCAKHHCIDPQFNYCIKMSENTYQGKKISDQYCVSSMVAVGVLECSPGTFCIDIVSNPTQCVDLSSSATCFVGIEKESQICVMDLSSGQSKKGVNYCKSNYCIAILADGLSQCEALSNQDNRRSKDINSFCQPDGAPNAIECGFNYCLDDSTKTCLQIQNQIYGKDKTTNKCIYNVNQGVLAVGECRKGYCKYTGSDSLQYCGELTKENKQRNGKEKSTFLCLQENDLTVQGIEECAPSLCISEVSEGLFQCVSRVNIANQIFSSKEHMNRQLQNVKNCQSVDISNLVFSQSSVTSNQLFQLDNCNDIVISDLVFNKMNLSNAAAIIKIVNSSNVTIQGNITMQGSKINSQSTLFLIENSNIYFQADQIYDQIEIMDGSSLFSISNAAKFIIQGLNITNSILKNNSTLFQFNQAKDKVEIKGIQMFQNLSLINNSAYWKVTQQGLSNSQYILQTLKFVECNFDNSKLFDIQGVNIFNIQQMNLSSLNFNLYNNTISSLISIEKVNNFSLNQLANQQNSFSQGASLIQAEGCMEVMIGDLNLQQDDYQSGSILNFKNIKNSTLQNLKLDQVFINASNNSVSAQIYIFENSDQITIQNIDLKGNSSSQQQTQQLATSLLTFQNCKNVIIGNSGHITLDLIQFLNKSFQFLQIASSNNISLSNLDLSNNNLNSTTLPFIQIMGITNIGQLSNLSLTNLNITMEENSNLIQIKESQQINLQNSNLENFTLGNGSIIYLEQIKNLTVDNIKGISINNTNINIDLILLESYVAGEQLYSNIKFEGNKKVSLLKTSPEKIINETNQNNTLSVLAQNTIRYYKIDDNLTIQSCNVSDITLSDKSAFILQSSNLVINNIKLQTISCSNCNGSAINIQNSNKINFNNLEANSNQAGINGGAVYVHNCKGALNISQSTIKNNQASLSGGGFFFDNVNFQLVNNIVENNTALIGGGVRFVNIVPAYSQSSLRRLLASNSIVNNKAAIFGQNVCSHIGKIALMEESNQLVKLQQSADLSYVNTQKQQLYFINNYRSGQQLNFNLNINLIDYVNGEIVNLSKNNWEQLLLLTNYNNPPTQLINEFINLQLKINYNSSSIRIDGELLKFFEKNFNFQQSRYIYNNLGLVGIPGTNSSFTIDASYVMQPDYTIGQYKPVTYTALVITYFRECVQGEIYQKNQLLFECYLCQEGKYSLQKPNQYEQQTCQSCPFEKAERCYGNTIQLRKGYWRKNQDSDLIVACSNQEVNCIGGLSSGDRSCYEGHIGALCEGCDIEGIFWNSTYATSSKYTCVKCSQIANNAYFMLFSFIYTFVSIALSVKSGLKAQETEVKRRNKVQPIMEINNIKVEFKNAASEKQNEGTIYIKIITNYLQIVSSISSFQLSFSASFLDVSNSVGQPISQSMNSLECFISSYLVSLEMIMIYKRLLMSLSLALIYFILFQFLYALYKIIIRREKCEFFVIITSFNFLILFLQPDLVSYMISIVSCRFIGDTYYVLGNVIHECFTEQYYYYTFLLVIPFLFLWVIALPLIQVYQLWKNKFSLDSPSVLMKYGFLYKEYRKNQFYWEFVKMYQKIMIIIVLNYYSQDIKVKGILIFAVIVMYALTAYANKPYRKNYFTEIDTKTSKILATTILTAVFISQIQYDYFLYLGLFIIVFINFTFIIGLINLLISCYTPSLESCLDKIKLKLIMRYQCLDYIFTISRTKRLKDSWQKFTKLMLQQKKRKRKSTDCESRFQLEGLKDSQQQQSQLDFLQPDKGTPSVRSPLKQLRASNFKSESNIQMLQIQQIGSNTFEKLQENNQIEMVQEK